MWGQILTLKNDPTCNFAQRLVTIFKLHWYGLGSNFLNDPTCISAPRVFIKYKLNWKGWGQILTLENDPTCSLAPCVIIKNKLHGMVLDSNFNLEKCYKI